MNENYPVIFSKTKLAPCADYSEYVLRHWRAREYCFTHAAKRAVSDDEQVRLVSYHRIGTYSREPQKNYCDDCAGLPERDRTDPMWNEEHRYFKDEYDAYVKRVGAKRAEQIARGEWDDD